MRSLGILSGLVVLSAAALVADRTGAVPLNQSAAVSKPIVQPVARKGTRNFAPGDADALTVPSDAQAKQDRDLLEQCIAIWDAGTHITKTKWREICKRQLKERSDLNANSASQ